MDLDCGDMCFVGVCVCASYDWQRFGDPITKPRSQYQFLTCLNPGSIYVLQRGPVQSTINQRMLPCIDFV